MFERMLMLRFTMTRWRRIVQCNVDVWSIGLVQYSKKITWDAYHWTMDRPGPYEARSF